MMNQSRLTPDLFIVFGLPFGRGLFSKYLISSTNKSQNIFVNTDNVYTCLAKWMIIK